MLPPPPKPNTTFPIDVVITWVDGEEPTHKAKRLAYMGPAASDLHANAINPHRWVSGDELGFCLRSIERNAPWVRSIFIVTDAQTPDLSALSKAFQSKIQMVDHKQIFAGYEHVLPTFNSLAIESMLWRIEGLAEHFIYFNDDVFLTEPLHRDDVFSNGNPVLRGKWLDHSDLGSQQDHFTDPTLFHDFMQLNAATLLDFEANHIFASAHVVFPMRVSVFKAVFAQYEAAFQTNISHRFRAIDQFQPQGLHNGACIRTGQCVLQAETDYFHLQTGILDDYPLETVRDFLKKALTPQVKFLCVNDLSQIESAIPDARDWIDAAIGLTACNN